MPRDIQVFLEVSIDGNWQLALPMIRNEYFNSSDPKQNWINDTMYISEYYPKPIYSDYNPDLWRLFGVEGKYPEKLRAIPKDSCNEILEYHKSFGEESFDEHWIECEEFISNTASLGIVIKEISSLVSKIESFGNPKTMRMVLWFSQ